LKNLENLEDAPCLKSVLLRRNSFFKLDSHSDSQRYYLKKWA